VLLWHRKGPKKSAPVLCPIHRSALFHAIPKSFTRKKVRPTNHRHQGEAKFYWAGMDRFSFLQMCFMGIGTEKGSWATNQGGDIHRQNVKQ
jgi:hypothetical protein